MAKVFGKTDRILKWTRTLTKDQMRVLLVELVEFGITAEDVWFGDDTIAPYWSNTGDPLVEGQQTHVDA